MDFSITSYFTTAIEPGPSTLRIASAFGLGLDEQRKFHIAENATIPIEPGRIVFIAGQSGSGKSTLLAILKNLVRPHIDLDRIRYDRAKILPDQFKLPFGEALHYLSIAGLADAFIFLRKPDELSDGQRYRFKLALALARPAKQKFIFADGFLENLDRISAKIIAHNVRKFADRYGAAFILASTNDDICDALKPDTYVEKGFGSETSVAQLNPSPCPLPPPGRRSCSA
jgi:hypothetical protein